ncbi:MAG: hypothetical protein ACFNUE_08290, partial [Bacteroides sp.]
MSVESVCYGRFFRGLLILLLVLPAPRRALGQFYPVHATVHLLPPLGHRLAVVATDLRELRAALSRWLADPDQEIPGLRSTVSPGV